MFEEFESKTMNDKLFNLDFLIEPFETSLLTKASTNMLKFCDYFGSIHFLHINFI